MKTRCMYFVYVKANNQVHEQCFEFRLLVMAALVLSEWVVVGIVSCLREGLGPSPSKTTWDGTRASHPPLTKR